MNGGAVWRAAWRQRGLHCTITLAWQSHCGALAAALAAPQLPQSAPPAGVPARAGHAGEGAPDTGDPTRRQVDPSWAPGAYETAFSDAFPFLLATEVGRVCRAGEERAWLGLLNEFERCSWGVEREFHRGSLGG